MTTIFDKFQNATKEQQIALDKVKSILDQLSAPEPVIFLWGDHCECRWVNSAMYIFSEKRDIFMTVKNGRYQECFPEEMNFDEQRI